MSRTGIRGCTGAVRPPRERPALSRLLAPITCGVKGRLEGGVVRLGRDGSTLYEQSGYGRPGREGISLSPVEALYLVHRGRIEITGESFESLLDRFTSEGHFLRAYLVYRDLRERGYVVQTGPHDFRVFRRGQKPGSGQSQYMVRVLSERDPIEFGRLVSEATSTANMRKSHLLAVVDDEDELTYYEVKLSALPERDSVPVEGTVVGRRFGWAVIASDANGEALQQAGYGTRVDEHRLKLAPVEALHLLEKGVLRLEREGGPTDDYRDAIARIDPEAPEKTAVYTHLRDRGYVPRTGYKFGHHYRVYVPGRTHSEMLVHAIPRGADLPMSVISRSVRLAHSVKKKMLFGCQHSEGIFFVEFARVKL